MATREPLVSVIVPVYNTMPYLQICLESLLNQTLGADRLEVVAVDDGSTDGSAEELDRWAETYPEVVRVVHQANSGGPAQPCNAGLEMATGRYVFFLGADDYLGSEALERLVRTAEAWDSDVVFGRMVGENGRGVDQRMFARTRRDIDFGSSSLAYTLSNTKLFRRRLVEDLGLRYALDLRIGSDQPFTVAALLAARRVSVLGGYPSYHAVRRDDASNISYSTHWRTKYRDIADIVAHLAALTPAGPVRDALFVRHFDWEIDQLLRHNAGELPATDWQELVAAVAELATAYLTPGVADRLSAPARIRLRLAQHGRLDTLAQVIAYGRAHPERAMTLTGPQALDWFPALDPGASTTPRDGSWPTAETSSWAELRTEDVGSRLRRRIETLQVRVGGARLQLRARVALRPESAGQLRVVLTPLGDREPVPAPRWLPVTAATSSGTSSIPVASVPVTVTGGTEDAGGTDAELRAELSLHDLVATSTVRRWSVRLRATVADRVFDQPVRGAGIGLTTSFRHRRRAHHLQVLADSNDQLVIRTADDMRR